MLGLGVYEVMRDRIQIDGVEAGGVQLLGKHQVELQDTRRAGKKDNQVWARKVWVISRRCVQLLWKQLVEQHEVKGVGTDRG